MTLRRKLYEKLQCQRCGHWFYSPQGQSSYCPGCLDVEHVERNASVSRDAARRIWEREHRV